VPLLAPQAAGGFSMAVAAGGGRLKRSRWDVDGE
jgi:hypothetical protein